MDIDDVIHSLANQIKSPAFTARLATIEASKGDGLTPSVIGDVHEAEKYQHNVFPEVEIYELRTEYSSPEDDVKFGTTTIALQWTHTGDDEESVVKGIRRLVRATRDTLWRSVLGCGLGIFPVLVLSEDYGPLMQGEATPFVKSAIVTVRVQQKNV
jgi:hypothetical protein